jgi:hypothetical protein
MNIKCWWYGHKRPENNWTDPFTCSTCGKDDQETARNLYRRNQEWLEPVFFLVGVAAFILVLCLIGWYWGLHVCRESGTNMGLLWKFYFWTGCYFEIDGRWVIDDLLKVVDVLK